MESILLLLLIGFLIYDKRVLEPRRQRKAEDKRTVENYKQALREYEQEKKDGK